MVAPFSILLIATRSDTPETTLDFNFASSGLPICGAVASDCAEPSKLSTYTPARPGLLGGAAGKKITNPSSV